MASQRHKNRIEVFFNAEDHRWFDKPAPGETDSLSDTGIKSDSKAPPKFEPNYEKLVRTGGENFIREFGSLVKGLDASCLRIVMKMLYDSALLTQHNFRIGQPVYWRAAPLDSEPYIDQWHRCYVIGLDQNDPSRIHVTGALSPNGETSAMVTVFADSLLLPSAFRKLLARMKKHGNLVTPKRQRRSILGWKAPPQDELEDIAREVPFLRDAIKASRVAKKQKAKTAKPKSRKPTTIVTEVRQGG